jgi:hypothetical protein
VRLLVILVLLVPTVVEAQMLGVMTATRSQPAKPAPPAPPPPQTQDGVIVSAVAVTPKSDEGRPKWAESFATHVTDDRMSFTSSVVAIPLRCDRCVFRVMANEVKTDVEAATPELRNELRQRIADVQSLIDNGGAYSVNFAREGQFKSTGGWFHAFFQGHAGLGKLDAPGDDASNRYAANGSLELFTRFDLGKDSETLAIVFAGRASGIQALSRSLLVGDGAKQMAVFQLLALVKVYGTTALTVSWTRVPGQGDYAPGFMIGFNAIKP